MSPLNVFTPRICLDFDGVVHSYTSGWQGFEEIVDPPVSGAFEAIMAYLDAGFEVAIFSSRSHHEPTGDNSSRGIKAMQSWFLRHGFSPSTLQELKFPLEKPPAILYVDDRAWAFNGPGDFPTVKQVREFQPWNKTPQASHPDPERIGRSIEFTPSRVPSVPTSYSSTGDLSPTDDIQTASYEDDGYPD